MRCWALGRKAWEFAITDNGASRRRPGSFVELLVFTDFYRVFDIQTITARECDNNNSDAKSLDFVIMLPRCGPEGGITFVVL
jgi:hypothetical protein